MLRQDRLYTHTEGVFVQRSALRKQATLHFEGFKDSLRPLATQKNFLIRNQYVNIFQMRPWSSLSVTFDFWLYLWAEIWIPNSASVQKCLFYNDNIYIHGFRHSLFFNFVFKWWLSKSSPLNLSDIFSSESQKGSHPELHCETICLLADRPDVRLAVGVSSFVRVSLSDVSHTPAEGRLFISEFDLSFDVDLGALPHYRNIIINLRWGKESQSLHLDLYQVEDGYYNLMQQHGTSHMTVRLPLQLFKSYR